MQRRLLIALGGVSLALALILAVTLAFVAGPGLVRTAFAQAGDPAQSPCLGSGLRLGQMPCARGAAQSPGPDGTPAAPQSSVTLSGNVTRDAESVGLAYYQQKYGPGPFTAKATDYGCHVQVNIFKDGKVVKSLGYDRAGGVYELN
ncbi:MAG: hypothetical protein Q8O07_00975 [Chloroflexota bacterium]|nr:hypothetical protein [Chloroflexota bacterium]